MPWSNIECVSDETEIIFEAEEIESSEDPPMQEWSSLLLEIPESNEKKILHNQGLYDPGSGEVCAKYIGLSESTIFQHAYYNYPAVTDPGIQDALFLPEKPITYPDDGQELYMATCDEMGQIPVRKFYQELLKNEINLAYYCVDPKGVRAMALALTNNNVVSTFNLSDNFLTDDSCYHLGEMLLDNTMLEELNLSGCKIKSSGVQRLLRGLAKNRYLKILNLNKNDIGDDGAEHVGKAVTRSLYLQELYLRYNNISAKGTMALATAFETSSKFIKLDFSWNNFMSPEPTYWLLAKLGESETIQDIDLSWCALAGPRIGTAIKLLMKAPNLRYLNLSNNGLSGEAITNLVGNFGKAKMLRILDLSFNPLTPADALSVISKIKSVTVQIENLLLENVYVNNEFLEILNEIKEMKCRKNFIVTYGGVVFSFKGVGPDIREIVLKRADYLSKKSKKAKKHPVDVALIILKLVKNRVQVMTAKDFTTLIRASGAHLDASLIDTMIDAFGAPGTPKNKNIDVIMLEEYVKRLWPERQLPPTPPPEPEPEPKPEPNSTVRNKRTKVKRRKVKSRFLEF